MSVKKAAFMRRRSRGDTMLCSYASSTATSPTPTREEVTRTCLEAHKLLMEIDPDNVSKFKEVTQFLANDLKRMKTGV